MREREWRRKKKEKLQKAKIAEKNFTITNIFAQNQQKKKVCKKKRNKNKDSKR